MGLDKLSQQMQKTLLQIGFGVTSCIGGYFDEDSNRVDMRSAEALFRRSLVYYSTSGGAPVRGVIDLTPSGWEVFYSLNP